MHRTLCLCGLKKSFKADKSVKPKTEALRRNQVLKATWETMKYQGLFVSILFLSIKAKASTFQSLGFVLNFDKNTLS